MSILNTIRYVLALLILATHLPSLLLWLVIHPWAAFWRRVGQVWTFVILGIPVAGYVAAVWLMRRTLLEIDLGPNWITMVLACFSLMVAILINRRRLRLLGSEKLSGFPELSQSLYPGKLMTEGIYGVIRHPRYVEMCLLVLGYSLFANYLAPYLVMVFSLPVLYLVVVLEERELRERFGEAYEEYCRRVPRFVPRVRKRQV